MPMNPFDLLFFTNRLILDSIFHPVHVCNATDLCSQSLASVWFYRPGCKLSSGYIFHHHNHVVLCIVISTMVHCKRDIMLLW